MAVKWTLLSDDNQSKKLVELLIQSIPHETKEHAEYVVKELHQAIKDINNVQKKFLDGEYPNSVNELAKQLDEIAKDHKLDSDELYGTVLSTLFKSNQAALKSIAKSDVPIDECDSHIMYPKNGIQRDEALCGMDWLLESLAKCHLGQILQDFGATGIKNDNALESYERNLVDKALNTDFLSKEETALKWLFATHAYIELRNNPDFKGLAMAEAIKQAMIYVTNLKYGYKKQQRGQLVAKLKKYVKSAYLAIITVLPGKIWQWRAYLLGVAFDLLAKEHVLSEIEQWLNGLSLTPDIKLLLMMGVGKLINGATIGWLYSQLEPAVIESFKDLGKEVLPDLCEAAKDALKNLNKGARNCMLQLRYTLVDICGVIENGLKDWLPDKAEEEKEEPVPDEQKKEGESEDEKHRNM